MFAAELPDQWTDLVRRQGESPDHATLKTTWGAFRVLGTTELDDDYEYEHLEVNFTVAAGGMYTPGVAAGQEATEVAFIRHVAIPDSEDYTAMFAFSIVAYFGIAAPVRGGVSFGTETTPSNESGWFTGPDAHEEMFRAVEESAGFRRLLAAGPALSVSVAQGDIE
jgi:hypothetical protein